MCMSAYVHGGRDGAEREEMDTLTLPSIFLNSNCFWKTGSLVPGGQGGPLPAMALALYTKTQFYLASFD